MAATPFLDRGSTIVMVVTFVLFVVAVFVKGLTHDLLLETGVFLVSVKLMMLAYKSTVQNETVLRRLAEISDLLKDRRER